MSNLVIIITEVIIMGDQVTFITAFIGGLISFFTPCVLPLVPGYLSLFSGVALDDIKDKTIYFNAMFIILFIGTLDEVIQWIVPGRIWNFKDVKLNFISGGLIQLAIWQVIVPKSIAGNVNKKSLRILSILFSFNLIFLGLCASNTPQRVESYTKQIPLLSFLNKEESMGEFGYKYKDPDIGIFYSRLNPIKLKKTDDKEGNKYAEILNKNAEMDYGKFLKKYIPASHPFLHELRVHIFRRDKYLIKAENTSDLKKKKKFYFISYKENLILQKYFTQSIQNSLHHWDKDKISKAESLIDDSKLYKSPVSANLFTGLSEKNMWLVIFTLMIILGIVNLVLEFRKTKKNNRVN